MVVEPSNKYENVKNIPDFGFPSNIILPYYTEGHINIIKQYVLTH